MNNSSMVLPAILLLIAPGLIPGWRIEMFLRCRCLLSGTAEESS